MEPPPQKKINNTENGNLIESLFYKDIPINIKLYLVTNSLSRYNKGDTFFDKSNRVEFLIVNTLRSQNH